jgi:uncharacterized protein (TIGR02001 family)
VVAVDPEAREKRRKAMRNVTSKGRTGETARRVMAMLLAALALGISSGAYAEESKGPSLSADITPASKYVWRGLILTDDPVLQPSVTLSHKNLSLNIWANTDLTDINGTSGEINELDYTIDYSSSVDKVNFSVGLIQYTFPHTDFEPTTEIYGSAGLSVLLSPTVSVYYDSDEVGGLYGTFGVSQSFPLGEIIKKISPSLDLSGSIAYATSDWNEGYYGVKSSGLVDLLLTASLSVPIDEYLSLAPFVSFSQVIDSDLKKAVADDNATFFGARKKGP